MTNEIQNAKYWLKSLRYLAPSLRPDVLGAIETLERGLDALECVQKPEKPNPLERFVPKLGEKYSSVNSCGIIASDIWDEDQVDRFKLASGNCYRTIEQAAKVIAMLKRIIELRGDFMPDIDTPYQTLWYMAYNGEYNKWYCSSTDVPSIGEIYLPTQEAGETLIKEFGDDLSLLMGRM